MLMAGKKKTTTPSVNYRPTEPANPTPPPVQPPAPTPSKTPKPTGKTKGS
jgi:hypothetical protein